ncbi:hypothetical protein Cgig2_016205 [Carnegiea gigantea]|uniref:Homogentisate phytyltransferase 1, chloroplastic n=1 Tax=Carnegiea gigantea TaxID=171969 RepID=A0A9Q1GVS2_9CARY|nr:hypothetical protein Cgig2_016205 [Carnegiea gigantea]
MKWLDSGLTNHSNSRRWFGIELILGLQGSRCTGWNIVEGYNGVSFRRHLLENGAEDGGNKSALCPRYSTKRLVVAFAGHPLETGPEAYGPKGYWNTLKNSADAFYRFSRPHTVIGTALSIVSVSLLAVQQLSDLSPVFFIGVLEAIIAALFMNIYIVGLNQLSDIEIDKVNKPYLPLASGEYSTGAGAFIVASFAILLPMFRWKRFAVVAATCILAVRAIIVQIAFFLHIQMHIFGRPAVFSRPLIFATAFMSFFSVVIALFKDIPDMEGDRIFGIQSFTVRLGQKRVSILDLYFTTSGGILCCHFSWGIFYLPVEQNFDGNVLQVLGHVTLATILWRTAKSTDLSSKAAITSFYMFIWKFFDISLPEKISLSAAILCRVLSDTIYNLDVFYPSRSLSYKSEVTLHVTPASYPMPSVIFLSLLPNSKFSLPIRKPDAD